LDEGLMDKTIAELIYVGLSTDTGHFLYSNTTKEVFELVSKLYDYDIDSCRIARDLYRNGSYNKLQLLVKAINSMRFFVGGRVCVMSLTSQDLTDCGCIIDDTENLINYAMGLKDVELAACMSQFSKNSYKVSFRSKFVDISAAAVKFGGGGHRHASGCMLFGHYEDVFNTVRLALVNEIE
ncbi:MAG: hypothetical protein FWE84_05565, partial [Firmicutes bacterium]|nr:hypothetical protein [Bacillota bacterium]